MDNKQHIFKDIEAVVFDFDGTLYDKKGFAFRLLSHNLKDIFLIRAERKTRHSLKVEDFCSAENFYKNFFGKMSALLKNKKYSEEYLEKWYFECYLPLLTNTLKKYYTAREGTSKLFEYLTKSNIKIAVFSDYSAVSERMTAIGLSSTFCLLFNAEEFGALKPSPRPFVEIANQLKVVPQKILVIGDREDTDGVGAKNASMKFLLLAESNKTELSDVVTWQDIITNI